MRKLVSRKPIMRKLVMRKSVRRVGLVISVVAIAGLALAFGLGIAYAQGPSGTPQPASSGKQLPTSHPYSVFHKQTTPSPYITSCPVSHLPQPGMIKEAFPNSDPTYAFQSAAIGVSGGQPYTILAGYARSNPTQGVILVQPISLDPCKDFVSHLGKSSAQANAVMPVWNTPSQDGVITLIGVSGTTISYTTPAGKAGHFDYVTHVFLP